MLHSTSRRSAQGLVEIAFERDGQGPQIVVLPSLGRGPTDYDILVSLLVEAGYSVIRPWPRGTGESRGPLEHLDLAELAEDVLAAIHAAGDARPVVAGHAFGNFVARTLASRHPQAARGVALLAASAGRTPDGAPPVTRELLASVYASGDLTLPDADRLRHLRTAFFASGNDAAVWLDGWYPQAKLAQARAYESAQVDEFFGAGGVPLLDLQAEDDVIAPRRYASVLRDALGEQVSVAVIAHAGHALVPEQPAAVCAALDRWVRTLPPAHCHAQRLPGHFGDPH